MSGLDALNRLIGESAAMQRVRGLIRRLAPSPVSVLVLGETGTGKELCAQALAALSGRGPLVALNCAAIPEHLVESELFGHEQGAFTGAVRRHIGVIEVANGKTLFLDELAELPSPAQAKLLRTLQSGEFQRVGSTQTHHSEFRIVAATSGDVDGTAAERHLRDDLLYRVAAARIWMPPLRARAEDIPPLAQAFLRGYLERCPTGPRRIAAEACTVLMQFPWPGNVRQLCNVVEAAAALAAPGREIRLLHVVEALAPAGNGGVADPLPTLAEARRAVEERAILEALRAAEGDHRRAAGLLAISRATLFRKLGRRRGNGSSAIEAARSQT